jgi:hypothetical protein
MLVARNEAVPIGERGEGGHARVAPVAGKHGPRGERTEKPLANVVEPGALDERRDQANLARAWESAGRPRPQGAIRANGEREPGPLTCPH